MSRHVLLSISVSPSRLLPLALNQQPPRRTARILLLWNNGDATFLWCPYASSEACHSTFVNAAGNSTRIHLEQALNPQGSALQEITRIKHQIYPPSDHILSISLFAASLISITLWLTQKRAFLPAITVVPVRRSLGIMVPFITAGYLATKALLPKYAHSSLNTDNRSMRIAIADYEMTYLATPLSREQLYILNTYSTLLSSPPTSGPPPTSGSTSEVTPQRFHAIAQDLAQFLNHHRLVASSIHQYCPPQFAATDDHSCSSIPSQPTPHTPENSETTFTAEPSEITQPLVGVLTQDPEPIIDQDPTESAALSQTQQDPIPSITFQDLLPLITLSSAPSTCTSMDNPHPADTNIPQWNAYLTCMFYGGGKACDPQQQCTFRPQNEESCYELTELHGMARAHINYDPIPPEHITRTCSNLTPSQLRSQMD